MRNRAGLLWWWKRKRARHALFLTAILTESGEAWTFTNDPTIDYILWS